MTIAERNNKLKHLITCMKCEVSGKCCDDNCPTQYDAGNMGEIIENLEAISKALEQEPNTWSLDDAREDFMHDVYNTLAFLPTNEEAYRIIDSFDRVTSSIEQEPVLDKIRAEINTMPCAITSMREIYVNRDNVINIIDKYMETERST